MDYGTVRTFFFKPVEESQNSCMMRELRISIGGSI